MWYVWEFDLHSAILKNEYRNDPFGKNTNNESGIYTYNNIINLHGSALMDAWGRLIKVFLVLTTVQLLLHTEIQFTRWVDILLQTQISLIRVYFHH